MHRRQELEARINTFLEKSEHAIRNINKLKMQAQGFVEDLNCESSELKEKFLSRMNQLDEFTYLVTDFNLAMGKLDSSSSIDYTPVQDTTSLPNQSQPQTDAFNLMDALSEPTPSTSKESSNRHRKKCTNQHHKKPKDDELLIAFSSTSCSSESVPLSRSEKKVQCEMTKEMATMKLDDEYDECKLPAQSILQIDHVYPGIVMHVDGVSFWVITDNTNEVFDLMITMTNFYKENSVEMSVDDLKTLTYCAVYDDTTNCYYRGFIVDLKHEESAQVFLVDTGETRQTKQVMIQPLHPTFWKKPPYARCCHLAAVDFWDPLYPKLVHEQEALLKELIGVACHIKIDDNSSESLDVYLIYSTGEVLNDLLQKKRPLPITESSEVSGVPELSEESFNIAEGPEYEDPVEAVTGYRSRDEIDICKHYKGGSKKTCYKGARCTKKHIRKHPGGWPGDHVGVPACYRPHALPAPGARLRVHVTYVAHFDRLYVHVLGPRREKDTINLLDGVPPATLDTLIRGMNSEVARATYNRLKMMPAPGELVAALYSDNKWYRARVISSTRADQSVEVLYIDYGQVVWVKEDAVAELDVRYCVQEAQALRCVLAGVAPASADAHCWALARAALTRLIHERTLDMHVVCQDYDEVVVELMDDTEYSIAEQLAAGGYVTLRKYSIQDYTSGHQKLVVP